MASTKHEHLKKIATSFFNKTGTVKCPAFPKEKVHFNSKGLRHLFYDGAMRARPSREMESRVLLLQRALKVIRKMPFWQEKRTVRQKGKVVEFWSLEAVVEERRIKVIIRQIGNGNKTFWSVIPSWRRVDGKVVNAKSDLEKE